MASNVYECLFILDSNRYARDPGSVSATIPSSIEEIGGEVLANRLWNEQRLAYTIKGQRKGTYWLTYFRVDSEKLGQFNRACQLNDNILRHMAIRVDQRLVDVLVSHALGKPLASSDPPKSESGGEAKTEAAKESAAVAEVATAKSGETG